MIGIAFGPVPSRRLGLSLGVNNIPPKICTYSCVYCQLGRTRRMQVERETFFDPERVVEDVRKKMESLQVIDFITFVPDGEPTLDVNIGYEIEKLKDEIAKAKVAVITNASLLWREDVRKDLSKADLVSVKIDSVDETIWRRINRPHGSLRLRKIMEGILDFSKEFDGDLITETMLVKGLNDNPELAEKVAEFVAKLDARAYLAAPIRPPAEEWVLPANKETIEIWREIFSERVEVDCITMPESDAFAYTGNLEGDLLSILAVHPMRESSLRKFLEKANSSWDFIERLIDEGKIEEKEYGSVKFYIRKF
ncbi:MAG: radical SAM protein [Archaeoglobus sp.]|nr:radical SAM protein [Archaeoglobus sp.]